MRRRVPRRLPPGARDERRLPFQQPSFHGNARGHLDAGQLLPQFRELLLGVEGQEALGEADGGSEVGGDVQEHEELEMTVQAPRRRCA